MHVALLGDSVFDNGRYTAGQPDVAGNLARVLGERGRVTLLARDGTSIPQVGGQLARLPTDAERVVVSAGGNDLWPLTFLMPRTTESTMAFLGWVSTQAKDFEKKYASMLDELGKLGRDLTVCTVYGAGLPDEKGERLRALLRVFNDIITQLARARHLRVIELRHVCTEPADFVNAIEPSAQGGRKIAEAIARSLSNVT